ncbi:MAG: type II toxin-antitoxin system RelB/DinJ family antitoxin [Defluviitaleaceae bacterium]|nr:type II toxin-antitoxin system RelB/DinJ family antitoxin [Defluviitaleaceae bacterium]
MKTANYNIRLDPIVKSKAEETFAVFGLNLSEAINVFLHTSIMYRGFPFEIREKVPNAQLRESIAEAEKMIQECEAGTRKPRLFANAREMAAAMDAEDAAEGLA